MASIGIRHLISVVFAAVITVFSYEALASLSAKSYVLDGLIGHWDGIENVAYGQPQSPSATEWTELTGQSPSILLPTGAVFGEDNLTTVRTHGGINNVGKSRKIVDAFNAQAFTCEIAFKKTTVTPASSGGYKKATAQMLSFPYQTSYWFGTADDTYVGFTPNDGSGSQKGLPSSGRLTVLTTMGQHSFSCVQDGTNIAVRADGSLEHTATLDSGTAGTLAAKSEYLSFNKCGSYDDTGLDGCYYSIRFYSRPLMPDEVKVNNAVDRVRFFHADPLGVVLPDGWRFSVVAGETNLERRCWATVSSPTGGTVSVNDGEAGEERAMWLVQNTPTQVRLAAAPSPGWTFVCWRGVETAGDVRQKTVSGVVTGDVTAVFRRLDALTARSYVNEGMIGQWDGVENVAYGQGHSVDATAWSDLVGKSPAIPLPAESSFVNENGLATSRKYGSSGSPDVSAKAITGVNAAEILASFAGARFTAEVAFDMTNVSYNSSAGYKNTACKLLYFGSDSFWIGLYDDNSAGMSFNCKNSSGTYGYAKSLQVSENVGTTMGNHTLSCGQDGSDYMIGFDGAVLRTKDTAETSDSISTSFKFRINGGYYNDCGLNGAYHSIRFYDRKLTADEVMVNNAVDQVRFFGKDPESCDLPQGYRFNAAVGFPLEKKCSVSASDDAMGQVAVGEESPSASVVAWVDQSTRRLKLTAVPAPGYKFRRWTGAISGSDMKSASGIFTVTGDVVAEFKETTGILLIVR